MYFLPWQLLPQDTAVFKLQQKQPGELNNDSIFHDGSGSSFNRAFVKILCLFNMQ